MLEIRHPHGQAAILLAGDGTSVDQRSVHDQSPFEPWAIARIVVAALGAGLVWFRIYEPVAQISIIGLLALAFSVWPVLREGV